MREIGTHDDLMAREGLYHTLVMAQIQKDEADVEKQEQDDVVEELEVGKDLSVRSLLGSRPHCNR